MGRIPVTTNRVSALSGRTNAQFTTRRASADTFGAQGGRALSALGQGVSDLAGGLNAYQKSQREKELANSVAQADFTARELAIRNEVGADASGYQEQVLTEYDAFVDEQADAIEDDQVRERFRARMVAQRASVSSRAAQYQFGTAAEHSLNQSNASLTALDNRVRLQPEQYDELVQQGVDVINAQTLPATEKSKMAAAWRQASAGARFEGLLEAATTVEDIDAIEAELNGGTGRQWGAEMSSADLNRTQSTISSARKAIQTQADADARAAVDTLDERAAGGLTLIPREELKAVQQVVAKSKNPVTQARIARIARDQEIIRQNRKLTPAQQRLSIENAYSNASLPPVVNSAITVASQRFGVSASYLASTVQREYGMYLKGDPDQIDYGRGNAAGASAALGVGQFIPSTWLDMMKDPTITAALPVDVTGMSDSQLLELRKDPTLSILAAAGYASRNAKAIKSATGRNATDAELYMGHFLGTGGVGRLLRMKAANPDVIAADMFPQAAKANPTIYYKKDGSARTVAELYDTLGSKHQADGGSTGVEYGDRETQERILDATERGVSDDPMTFANSVGNASLGDIFSEGGMGERGTSARSVADYYNIPYEDMKPFTKSEEEAIASRLANGDADEALDVLSRIQGLGGDMARAGLAQVSKLNNVYAYAGGLSADTGQTSVAADIVRGQKRIEENPDLSRMYGATEQDLSTEFYGVTDGALMGMSGSARQAIYDAALAHYAETAVARGAAGRFDRNKFAASVNAVLGAQPGSERIGTVNGATTILPPGVSGGLVEQAFEVMTLADWSALSEQGVPPRYASGEVADPADLRDDAQLQAIGGDRYRVSLQDGTFLTTGRLSGSGRAEVFVVAPERQQLEAFIEADRRRRETPPGAVPPQEAPALSVEGMTPEDWQALADKFGVQLGGD